MFYIESHWIHRNTWKPIVCCFFSGCGINAFRMASSNSSLGAKSCPRAYVAFLAFLAGIFYWHADSTFVVRPLSQKHIQKLILLKHISTLFNWNIKQRCSGTTWHAFETRNLENFDIWSRISWIIRELHQVAWNMGEGRDLEMTDVATNDFCMLRWKPSGI
jgi:hypothetical protein